MVLIDEPSGWSEGQHSFVDALVASHFDLALPSMHRDVLVSKVRLTLLQVFFALNSTAPAGTFETLPHTKAANVAAYGSVAGVVVFRPQQLQVCCDQVCSITRTSMVSLLLWIRFYVACCETPVPGHAAVVCCLHLIACRRSAT